MLGHGSCSQSTQRSCWVLELIDDSVGIWLVKVCEQILFDCGFDNGPWSAPQQQEAAAYGAYVHAHMHPMMNPMMMNPMMMGMPGMMNPGMAMNPMMAGAAMNPHMMTQQPQDANDSGSDSGDDAAQAKAAPASSSAPPAQAPLPLHGLPGHNAPAAAEPLASECVARDAILSLDPRRALLYRSTGAADLKLPRSAALLRALPKD